MQNMTKSRILLAAFSAFLITTVAFELAHTNFQALAQSTNGGGPITSPVTPPATSPVTPPVPPVTPPVTAPISTPTPSPTSRPIPIPTLQPYPTTRPTPTPKPPKPTPAPSKRVFNPGLPIIERWTESLNQAL